MYKDVSDARERVPALKKLSTHQVKVWVAAFNAMHKKGMKEEEIFPQAMAAAKRASKKALKKSEEIIKGVSYRKLNDLLRDAIKSKYASKDSWSYVEDFDDESVIFSVDSNGIYKTYKADYSVDEAGVVSLDSNLKEVVATTVYIEKAFDSESLTEEELESLIEEVLSEIGEEEKEESLVKKVIKSVKDFFRKEVVIIKQFDEEKMQAIEVMYVPDSVDAHGHAMTSDEARKMVDSFNLAIKKGRLKGNLCHYQNTDAIEPLKAWVTECESRIGDTDIPEGWPLVKVQFHDKELWELRKAGVLMGVSIGARGKLIPNPEYKEEE